MIGVAVLRAERVGQVTSAAWSPDFETNVAIGMVRMTHWDAGLHLRSRHQMACALPWCETNFGYEMRQGQTLGRKFIWQDEKGTIPGMERLCLMHLL